ncbi:MAG: tRNA (N(6)-L-threonylcarbamoyladenosine(37)-C(2))-methylthiotransferase MtaB [Bacteroidia bacterium]|nr:tRNA (N(6)-L-threonylcarbamoyladenosine(37)-C(2))-methylthiotransferase MtaB [Bacteroidia bacterium]
MSKVAFHTLGCKLNFSETSTIARQFRAAGWERVDFPHFADVYVVNTCSVTDNADKECKTIVNRAMAVNPEGKVIIVGCYAQLKPDEIAAIPGVDLVLGATEKFNALNYLSSLKKQDQAQVMACEVNEANTFISAWSAGDRTRTFLKVQDGCDYSCTFCTIPLARGRSRSNTIENVVEQARSLVRQGVKEIVLTGVNLGDFGIISENGKHAFHLLDLARGLDKVEGLQRIRMSSIEPNLLEKEIIELTAHSTKFQPHFHMPLQSGSNEILALMRRRYKRELYAERVHLIRERLPHAAIGVDVIVGFPGESDRHFRETFDFLHDLPVSYLHVFTYSERDRTPAVSMPEVVPQAVRKERNRILRNLSAKKLHDFTMYHLGDVFPVLFEEENNKGMMHGYTSNYIRVEQAYDPESVNKIIPCKLSDVGPSGLVTVIPSPEVKPEFTMAI